MSPFARLVGAERDPADRGTSLVELVIVTVLLSLISAMVLAWVIAAQRQVASAQIRLADVNQSRLGMDVMTKTLRTAVRPALLQAGCRSCVGAAATAPALTAATKSSVTMYANFGDVTGPVLVTFTAAYDSALGMATLTQTSQAPDIGSAPDFRYTSCVIGGPGCPTVRRTLVRGLTWPLPVPLFTYYDNTGAALVPDVAGVLSAVQLPTVDAVDITMPVRTPNGYGTRAMTVTGRVSLPNAGIDLLSLLSGA